MSQSARRVGLAVFLVSCVDLFPGAVLGDVHSPEKSPITVQDLIRFATIGDPGHLDYYDKSNENAGISSPHRSHVAVLVHGGNPERKTNDATLLVYRTAQLFEDPSPQPVAQLASTTNNRPMAMVRWLSDNETLVFAGTQGAGPSQVYSVNIRTLNQETLTQENGRLIFYDLTPSARRLITLAYETHVDEESECRQGGCRIAANDLWTALKPTDSESSEGASISVYDLDTHRIRALPNLTRLHSNLSKCQDSLEGGISPDGRYALRQCSLRDRPVWWQAYTVDPELREALAENNAVYAQQLMLIDLDGVNAAPVSDAPSLLRVSPSKLIWIDGGRSFILPGVLESLLGVDAGERARRAASFAVLLVDPATLQTTRIARLDPKVAAFGESFWNEKTQTLTMQPKDAKGAALPLIAYKRNAKRWAAVPAQSASTEPVQSGTKLVVEQSVNERPILMAVDGATGMKKRLLDPNAWLEQRQVGRVEKITWKTPNGHTWRGGLYYSPGYRTGQRYPLLMQTHGFEEDSFTLNGEARLFPGQALASHGVMVLQIAENLREGNVVSTPKEWPAVQAGYEAAIDHLDAAGLIDRNKVGIIGWSRTGPHAGYTITHSDYPFAAAALTAAADFGWYYHILAGAPDSHHPLYGAAPFGAGMGQWLKYAATFNLDRVQTPVFLWGGSGGRVSLWDWYAGLRTQKKPVEFWAADSGIHEVFKVPERLRLNQLLVDWFRFWLKDEEDRDPMKAQQYTRWGEMREQQAAILKQSRRPLLEWKATPISQR